MLKDNKRENLSGHPTTPPASVTIHPRKRKKASLYTSHLVYYIPIILPYPFPAVKGHGHPLFAGAPFRALPAIWSAAAASVKGGNERE